MLKNRFKIDSLVFVLAIGVVSLFVFSKNVQEQLAGKETVLKKFEQLEDLVHFPDTHNRRIFQYDKAYKIQYSVNGGDTYVFDSEIDEDEIVLNSLSHYITSFRSKPVYGVQPQLKSILVKANHSSKHVYSEPKMITFLNEGTHSLPILSLITSEKGLFSEDKGIMNMGMDAWHNVGFYLPFWERNANYKRRGEQSKRETYWQLIEKGIVVFEAKADLQVSGNATRSFPQKSFKLKANRLYGYTEFKYPFFGKKGIKKYASLVIRNSGNDNTKTLFADLLMHQLAEKSNVLVQKGMPIVLYMNGNYWGIYNLRERIDLEMIAAYEKAKPAEVTILEGGGGLLKDGHKSDQEQFLKLIETLRSKEQVHDLASIENIIDLNSFIDYIIFETYFGNGDWLHNNALWYRADKGRWKWVLNDLDYALTYQGQNNVTKNYFDYLSANRTVNATLYNYLVGIESFRTRLKTRAVEVLKTNLSEKAVTKKVKKLKMSIDAEINWHINRWTNNLSKKTWEDNVQANLDFLIRRNQIYLKQIEAL